MLFVVGLLFYGGDCSLFVGVLCVERPSLVDGYCLLLFFVVMCSLFVFVHRLSFVLCWLLSVV